MAPNLLHSLRMASDGLPANVSWITDAICEEYDRAAARLAFLAEASRILASSLEFEETMSSLVRLIVPYLADWCTVTVVEPGKPPKRVAAGHVDPVKEKLISELEGKFPPDPDAPFGIPRALRTRKVEFASEFDMNRISSYSSDPDFQRIIRGIGIDSYITIPFLTSKGEAIGAIWLANAGSGRHFTKDDLSTAEELARRATQAIQNVLQYEAASAELERLRIGREINDSFLALQSHDIKSAITSARLNIQLLIRQLESRPELRAVAERALGGIDRVTRMTDHLRCPFGENGKAPLRRIK